MPGFEEVSTNERLKDGGVTKASNESGDRRAW
jgi:hypothetical protein